MKTVLLFGNSIFISGLAPVLGQLQDFSARHVGVDDLDNLPEADVILIDLCDAEAVNNLPKLCASNVPVVSIHPEQEKITIFSSSSQAIHSIQEVLSILQSWVDHTARQAITRRANDASR